MADEEFAVAAVPRVFVDMTIGSDGLAKPGTPRANSNSSGSAWSRKMFESAREQALEDALTCVFEPAIANIAPVATRAHATFVYALPAR